MKRTIALAKKMLPLVILFIFICFTCNYVYAQPVGTCTVIQQPCHNDGILSVSVTSGMTPPLTFTYNTYYSAITHSNINAMTDTLDNIIMCDFVNITDNLGNVLFLWSGMHPPFHVDYPQVTHAICPDTMGSILVTINQGAMPDSVHWYASAMPAFGPYIGTGNPMSLAVGSYMIVVTDSNGCTTSPFDTLGLNNWEVESLSNLNYSVQITPAGCTNGTATVTNITGGLPPFTYQWSNGAITSSINNLLKGYYYVTVTDSQACSTVKMANVNQIPVITVHISPTNATCLQNDGSVIAFGSGGTPPYSYAWSNGMTGQTISGLYGGTHLTVIATDANGCFGNSYAYIGSTTPITVTCTTTPSSCITPTGSATLNITGGTNPYTITWNTYPQQNGISISNMPSGNYPFKVTDGVGCVRTGTAHINPQSTITANASAVNPVCPGTTGIVSVNASGSNPPFSYLWNNGDTAQTITLAPIGSYCCTITDNIGCQVIKCTTVHPLSPITIGFSATPASCIYASDGSLYAMAGGGTAPYTYHWPDGQTGNTATGLTAGGYSVHVQDAQGCSLVKYGSVGYDPNNDDCYCTISGKVYTDLNTNCTFDVNEQGISHVMVHCSGFGYTWTDANGNYTFMVPTGSYVISENILALYPLAPCQNNSIPAVVTADSGCIYTVNFANVINPLHDIHIITGSLNQAVPGYSYTQRIIVQNEGTINETDIQFGYRHDGQLNYLYSMPALNQLNPIINPDWYSITSGFPALAPGNAAMIQNNFQVPVNIPINTQVFFYDTTAFSAPMNNWLIEYSPWNNIQSYHISTVSSYDPNFKEVSPTGSGSQGYISRNDSVLDYILHFQNTGNYYAQNIVLVDTLDEDLEWTSLRPGYSDHNYTANMSENGVLTFTFKNINLPYQSINEFGSRGMVTYSIKQKPQLSIGTEIKNSADIYFDYNAPVSTNTTLNTIDSEESQDELFTDHSLRIYPIPATDFLNIDFENPLSGKNSLQIYSTTGQMVYNRSFPGGSKTERIDVSQLQSGMYFIRTVDNEYNMKTGKFIK
ncbi:MAG TPA: T9SS type A sorting domain-containing protein [Bacteroidales bacterium]|nr:T9SS type A sorting domain-containing protein [Bacteroidales bacterium]